jgi:hypothetical protein
VVAVQQGVESFSDGVLTLMDKGVSTAQQLQAIKWFAEAGITNYYNLIFGTPGETAAHYQGMTALVPFIEHLPPPQLSTLQLQRFSVYHADPAASGITAVTPKPHYGFVFRAPGVDLMRVAYYFDYHHDARHDRALLAAWETLYQRLTAWQERNKLRSAEHLDDGAAITVIDRRAGDQEARVLIGVAAELYRFLDRAHTRSALGARFPHAAPPVLDALLAVWTQRRWICPVSGRLLAVLPRRSSNVASTPPPRLLDSRAWSRP